MGVLIGLLAAAATLVSLLVIFSWAVSRDSLARVPPLGKFMDIDGARIHYLDKGQGQPVLMVHGLGGQMRNFSYALLDKLTDRYRVILIDRPGSGHSTAAPGTRPSLAGHAALIASVIARLNLARPLVVGHSLGGAIALTLALDHPACVGGLALIAPLANVQDKVPPAFSSLLIRSSWLRVAVANTVATPLGMLFAERGRAMVFSPELVPDDFTIKGGGLLTRRPEVFMSASADIMNINEQMAALVARYPAITIPIDILFGRDDAILDPQRNGKDLSGLLPGMQLTLCDGGHMLPITRPELVSAWLEAVLTRNHASA